MTFSKQTDHDNEIKIHESQIIINWFIEFNDLVELTIRNKDVIKYRPINKYSKLHFR